MVEQGAFVFHYYSSLGQIRSKLAVALNLIDLCYCVGLVALLMYLEAQHLVVY